jgi:hypothetical protein
MSDFPRALREQWPHAPYAVITAIDKVYEEVFAKYGINSPLVVCHLMAQLSP